MTSVVTDPDFQWGRLTPHGVIYVYLAYDATFDERNYPVAIWRDGTLRRITNIGLSGGGNLVVRGSFGLAGNNLVGAVLTPLHLYDLASGTDQETGLHGQRFSLSDDGAVVGVRRQGQNTSSDPCCDGVWVYRNGATSQLLPWPGPSYPYFIGFDGTQLAYLGANGPTIHDGSGDHILASNFTNTIKTFTFSKGWAAYEGDDTPTYLGPQVWRRYPDGRLEQASFLMYGAYLGVESDTSLPRLDDDLAPNGDIVFTNGTTASTRYLSHPGIASPIALPPASAGRMSWKDGSWYLKHGTTLCALQPPADADAGAAGDAGSDAATGTPDAGTGADAAGDAGSDAATGTPDAGSGADTAGDAGSDAATSTPDAGTGADAAGDAGSDAATGTPDADAALDVSPPDAGSRPDAGAVDRTGTGGAPAAVDAGGGDARPITDASSPVDTAAKPLPSDGGCSCATVGSRGAAPWSAIALAILACGLASRRRSRAPLNRQRPARPEGP